MAVIAGAAFPPISARVERKTWIRIGLAAAIVLAPGGFVLGASLAAKRWRERRAADEADAPEA